MARGGILHAQAGGAENLPKAKGLVEVVGDELWTEGSAECGGGAGKIHRDQVPSGSSRLPHPNYLVTNLVLVKEGIEVNGDLRVLVKERLPTGEPFLDGSGGCLPLDLGKIKIGQGGENPLPWTCLAPVATLPPDAWYRSYRSSLNGSSSSV